MLASVCTGSLVYADAGLLAGCPATAHWSALHSLADLGPTIDIRASKRFATTATPHPASPPPPTWPCIWSSASPAPIAHKIGRGIGTSLALADSGPNPHRADTLSRSVIAASRPTAQIRICAARVRNSQIESAHLLDDL
jgi:hypothetical protein